MSTYTRIYYHIVFSTKGREPVLHIDKRERLYEFIGGIIRENIATSIELAAPKTTFTSSAIFTQQFLWPAISKILKLPPRRGFFQNIFSPILNIGKKDMVPSL